MKKVVKGFASVILASMFVFIGCKPPTSTSEPKITITVAQDDNVEKVEPETLSVAKGSEWSTVKPRIKVKYKKGFVEAGWKLDGNKLEDNYEFTEDKTIYVCSKDTVTLSIKGDERINLSLQIEKPYGIAWSSIKAEIEGQIKLTTDWANGDYAFYEWRLGDETGKKIRDDYTFSDNTTVYAVSNYTKWKIEDDGSGNKVLSGVEGSKPCGKIILPDGVRSIGESAFSRCSSLTAISIPNNVTSIGDYAFGGCSALKTITIPDSVETIKDNALARCSELTSITIPNGVTSIGQWAFSDCSSLTGITIPDSVTSINRGAFRNCSSLTGITIPNGVTSIESDTFSGCKNITTITIEANNVTSIGSKAFYACSSLTAITIPNGVTSIEYQTFKYCSSLSTISIPASVTKIRKLDFEDCKNLTTLTVDEGNAVYKSDNNIIYTKDGKSLIAAANGLTGTIDIPDGVSTIGDDAFKNCSSLTGITIPNSVTSIESDTFSGCESLTAITIPANVTSIGSRAFDGCSSLASATFKAPEGWKDSSYNTVDVSTPEKAVEVLIKGDSIYKR